MKRFPLVQFAAILAGSALVVVLFVARGFRIEEHARIMLGALALIGLVGAAWTLASAAEDAGGLRKLGVAGVVIVLVAAAVATLLPALVLALLHLPPAR
jgi:hypothetical protein